ncbi:hypothetical protein [Rheinheimera soli]|uniref:Lipoprotein n=1 Tax=Rheinheimera soli TaxID=443616 RepID=A0ABU1W5M4_9GAMM|nr:hypothetical protein [Rheinheimera soli]MDR7123165.1 hypothetical protein [Rheinheimera soli]
MKIYKSLVLGVVGVSLLISCSGEQEVEIVKNEKLCLSNEQIVAIDKSATDLIKEVTISRDLGEWSGQLSGNAYVHISADTELSLSKFASELELSISESNNIELDSNLGLVKVADKESPGVFHLFEKTNEITLNGYIGSCFTLSESMGECTLESRNQGYQLKIDIQLNKLIYWEQIRKHLAQLPEKLSCESKNQRGQVEYVKFSV